ncbi:MAG: hypothetical protein IIB95_02965 [Candidatus Marinimicrobia bacterium]|nr:hypothetical protein [Candidatus Neomarinimicrobiota bacterium]
MKFTEAKLEQAVIELFEAKGYKHFTGAPVSLKSQIECTEYRLNDRRIQF